MKTEQFCFWLQGFFEIRSAEGSVSQGLSEPQVEIIKRHLAMVFLHDLDPATEPDPKKAEALQAAHDGKKSPKRPPRPSSDNQGGFGGHGHSDTVYRC